jgi:cell division protein FtsW
VSFQPSEIAKLVSVIFTAALLDRRMHRIRDLGGTLLPIVLAVLGMVTLVLAGRDFGTSAVIVGVVLIMLFAAGLSYRHLAIALVPITAASSILIAFFAYRMNRLLAFWDPWKYQSTEGYQVVQSMLAVASGGLLGAGLMNSRQKLLYLPEPHTDFIFAVIAEEFGLFGTTLVVLCFAVIVWRGLRISLLAPDRFGSLLALGITMTIGLQGLINISVALSLLPTKGIALPFVSSGGSSLLLSMISMGILLNISQHVSGSVAPAKTRTDWTLGAQEA